MIAVTPTLPPKAKNRKSCKLVSNAVYSFPASMTIKPFEVIPSDAPLPPRRPPRSAVLFDALVKLQVGKSMELNRDYNTAHSYVSRFRALYDRGRKFKVRQTKPGWSRVWRVE